MEHVVYLFMDSCNLYRSKSVLHSTLLSQCRSCTHLDKTTYYNHDVRLRWAEEII